MIRTIAAPSFAYDDSGALVRVYYDRDRVRTPGGVMLTARKLVNTYTGAVAWLYLPSDAEVTPDHAGDVTRAMGGS